MKKTCVVCDVCGNDIVNGRVMWTQAIINGRGRHGNSRMDVCNRCFLAFQAMLKRKDGSETCAVDTTTRSV